jgi:hypothetical protein
MRLLTLETLARYMIYKESWNVICVHLQDHQRKDKYSKQGENGTLQLFSAC